MNFFITSGPGYNANHRGERHFLQNSFERRYFIDSKLNKLRIMVMMNLSSGVKVIYKLNESLLVENMNHRFK